MADYRSTVYLPKTDFPMRANLPEREPEMLRRWQEERIYEQLVAANEAKPKFVLHDGPPYANNDIHQGHALNKILKDLVGKYHNLSGDLTDVVPGWDCHGLPIELAVDKLLGPKKRAMSPGEFRRECRRYAEKWIGVQRESFKRLGVFMRWDDPYVTMSPAYEAQTLRELARFAERGLLYRQKKPVYWDPIAKTALAEAEIEYPEGPDGQPTHVSPSIHVAMQVTSDPAKLSPSLAGTEPWLVIWTTTPWTLPANLAIAAGEKFEYVAYRLRSEANPLAGEKLVIVAKDLLARFLAETAPGDLAIKDATAVNVDAAAVLADPTKIVAYLTGAELAGATYRHPFYDRTSPVLLGEHVTLEAGTGLVHTAPGHGVDDYVLGRKHGLEVLAPLDDSGRYTHEAPGLEGQFVFDANPGIVSMLADSGHLVSDPKATITHKYPYSWRTDKPVVLRATDQWFISLDKNGLRQTAMEAIDRDVTWVPHWGKPRIEAMMSGRPDWCISRQRAWGVPIAVFYCETCAHCVADPEIMNHVADVFEKESADAWVNRTATELLPPGFTCPGCGGTSFRKENDILDVWFDSGVSYANVAESGRWKNQQYPVDLYLEGSDQHRGWFNSALICSVATRGRAPYRAVLTHGFVVDGQGRKLSKRLGNGVPMDVMLKKYGADIIRLWVAAEDYREDIRLSDEILNNLSEGYRKIRNTLRWLLGSLDGFDPARDTVSPAQMTPIDRWALEQTARWVERMHEAYSKYEFHLAYHATIELCAKTLSAFYFDVLKDRLYTRSKRDPVRLGSQSAIRRIADALCRMLAPILSFTTDEAWRLLPGRATESVFLAGMPTGDELRAGLAPNEGAGLVERYEAFQEKVRAPVAKALEELKAVQQPLFKELKELDATAKKGTLSDADAARRKALEAETIGSSLDARLTLHATGSTAEIVGALKSELAELLIVSQVDLATAPIDGRTTGELTVQVAPARGEKCVRCWVYAEERGADPKHPELCPKCAAAVNADFPDGVPEAK